MGLRLGASFAAILLLFGAALVVVLHALGQMAVAEQEVVALDRAKHAGHRVAALVREQYIHQAHTIIEGNRSHLDHYQEVANVTRTATEQLATFARSDEERALAGEIATLVRKNHDDFMAITLPAVERGEHDDVVRLHADMEHIVSGVAKRVKDLNGHFEAGSDAARARADEQRRRVRFTLLGCFGAAAALAAVLGVLTTRSIASRVRLLREGARRLGDGDLSRRIALEGNDELAELSGAFDDMASRLEKHQAELLRSQKLASIGRLSAGVAHEINGPLGIILGYAKVIRKQGPDEEALQAIEDEAKQCQRIVEALLDMSRQEKPSFDAIDLAQLARDGIERLRATGALGNRRATVTAASPDILAVGDEAKLRQVILNLIRNAIEVTPDGGSIEVDVHTEKQRAVLAVVDHGPGISEEAKAQLFEPFYTTKPQGTGLGLAIARAIVEAHRGEIRVRSSEGGGARIEVDLEAARSERALAMT
jgi:signal transduction histidine kinase